MSENRFQFKGLLSYLIKPKPLEGLTKKYSPEAEAWKKLAVSKFEEYKKTQLTSDVLSNTELPEKHNNYIVAEAVVKELIKDSFPQSSLNKIGEPTILLSNLASILKGKKWNEIQSFLAKRIQLRVRDLDISNQQATKESISYSIAKIVRFAYLYESSTSSDFTESNFIKGMVENERAKAVTKPLDPKKVQ